MGNIVGEPFKDYVKKQINLRQEIHGKKIRTEKELIYLNSRTSWVKLASGTSIEQDRLDLIPELKNSPEFLGTGLARNFLLFNGTNTLDKNVDQQAVNDYISNERKLYRYLISKSNSEILASGIGQNTILPSSTTYSWGTPKAGIGSNGAYGMGGTEFGQVPMPGIESVSVKNLERGSIKRATIQLKAYNKLQFDIIDILYLRLGYSILLEWGDSHYLDNNNTLNPVTPLQTSIIEKTFFKNNFKPTYYECLDVLEKEREKYSGCYDGILGKISNFKWTFNPDGTYNITLDVISLGDVIESLKLNVAPYSISKNSQEYTDDEELSLIDSKKDANELARIFYEIKTQSVKKETVGMKNQLINAFDFDLKSDETTGLIYNATYYPPKRGVAKIPKKGYVNIGRTVKTTDEVKSLLPLKTKTTDKVLNDLPDKIKLDYEFAQMSYTQTKHQWYVRFGTLLSLINKVLIQNLKNNDGTVYSSLKIYTNPDTNLMYYIPNMVSLDPRVCIISNHKIIKPDNLTDTVFGGLHSFSTTSNTSDSTYGKIMNIYININHVLELFNESDKDGNIIFMDFLRKLCDNVSNSLGKVNKLQPKVDPETNLIKIFDQTPLPNKESLPSNIYPTGSNIEAPFNLYGYNVKDDTSNFIHNVGLTTEITPEYATMITVGSTANGYVVGSEATAFSKWNLGIIDRFKEAIELNNTPQNDKLVQKYKTIQENYFKRLEYTSLEDDNSQLNWYAYTGIVIQDGWDVAGQLLDTIISNPFTVFSKIQSDFKDKTIIDAGIASVSLSDDDISTNLEVMSEYYKLLQAQAVQNAQDKNKSSAQGFLPFNLKLDMDGLSGMKIYQKINIDSTFLPTNYPEKMEFVTTNINHELKDNKWTTKIDSIATVKNLITTEEIFNDLNLELNNIQKKGILTGTIQSNGSSFTRITNSSTIIKDPKTNPNPIIIEDEKQKEKYLKLYKNQLGPNFDNFVIRKGSDPDSYAMKIINEIKKRKRVGKQSGLITVKNSFMLTKPGELGNGGDISKGLYKTLMKLINLAEDDKYDDVFDLVSTFRITAGNDHFHQGRTVLKNPRNYPRPKTSPINPSNTTHTRGLAIDVGVNSGWVGNSQNEINLMIDLLKAAGFTGVLYHNPPHIHANIDPTIDHSK